VSAHPKAIVLDKRVDGGVHLLSVTDDSTTRILQVDAAQAARIDRGQLLAFVARRPAGARAYRGPDHLVPHAGVYAWGGTATRLTIGARDEKALVTLLRSRVRSGHLSHNAGPALVALFDLAGATPAWSLADFRAAIWSLPGNQYGEPWQYAQAWNEILRHALQHATRPALAVEIERALPSIIQGFANQPGGKRAASLPAEVVRNFVTVVAIDAALLHVRNGDPASAERILALADGPLAAFASAGTPIGAEAKLDDNHAARRRVMRAMVRGLAGRSAADLRKKREHDSFDANLFAFLVRPYTRPLREQWAKALVAAGWPDPRVND
jgi:hypothetical protein